MVRLSYTYIPISNVCFVPAALAQLTLSVSPTLVMSLDGAKVDTADQKWPDQSPANSYGDLGRSAP
jgi:hypothetical protein